MRLPIRVRMTAGYVLLLALIVTAVGAFVVVRLRADLMHEIDGSLRPANQQIATGYRAEGPVEVHDVGATVLSGERAATQVLDPAGRVLFTYGDRVSRRPMLDRPTIAAVLAGRRLTRTETLGADGQRFRVVAQPVRRKGQPQVVASAESLRGVDRSVHRVLVLFLIAGPVVLLLTALGGWWLARRALRPIDRMSTRAARIGVDRLHDRLAVPGTGDEVAQLATTLNTMLDRIQRGVEEQHRLVADASHELRTPLAAMRAELDVSLRADELSPAAREVLQSTREEVDRLSRTVDDLLTLATLDEGRLELRAEPVALRALAERVVDALAPVARTRHVVLTVDGPDAIAHGDADGLVHVLRNVVENAIEFSPEGGEVDIRTWAADGEVGVAVGDRGPGVAPELRERIFDRFFRADPSRTRATGGSGLGLAIAREIALAHDGRLWVEGRADGGSAFRLALPPSSAHLSEVNDRSHAALN